MPYTVTPAAQYFGSPRWPFFHRLRIDFKAQHYKVPNDASARLEVNDKIDASATKEEFNHITRAWQDKDHWYAATVVGEDEARVPIS